MSLHKFDSKKEIKKLDFKKNKSKYIRVGTICISFLVVIISIIYFTYSKFTLTDTFKTAESTVDTFVPGDYILDFYVDGERTLNVPTNKYDGVVTCNNGAVGVWNSSTSSVTVSNVTTKTKCNVNLTVNHEPAEPELYSGLIPITYDNNNNILIADTNSEWYNYSEHEWANAILINQSNTTTKNKYINSDGSFKSGTTVSMSDILQMYVWIPRYKYKLFNVDGASIDAQMIEVEFESKDIAKSTGSTNGEWLTHPAFTFGTTELNGIWVGKFETSGSTGDVTIIPNVSSLRNQTVGNMFNASRAIESTAKYGLSSNEIDTHMMKNMEWGAVTYLTNSKYGRYNDGGSCISSGCEVWINPNSNYTTGCAGESVSAAEATSCNQWNSLKGVNASTTGNIYGIYDMSGGAYEYVMGNYKKTVSNSEIDFNSIESKYYDLYTGTSISYGKLGDATKETQGWNSDSAYFVFSIIPWFARGGYRSDGADAGVFYFRDYLGVANSSYSFRVVLSSE